MGGSEGGGGRRRRKIEGRRMKIGEGREDGGRGEEEKEGG